MTKDRERIERRLAVVDAYEASGQKASILAAAHDVALRDLASWCGHARRWRARLQADTGQAGITEAMPGFVAARLPANVAGSVRVEVAAASGLVTLHWPLGHVRELAAWLREVAR